MSAKTQSRLAGREYLTSLTSPEAIDQAGHTQLHGQSVWSRALAVTRGCSKPKQQIRQARKPLLQDGQA
jgi:hypothetical protein